MKKLLICLLFIASMANAERVLVVWARIDRYKTVNEETGKLEEGYVINDNDTTYVGWYWGVSNLEITRNFLRVTWKSSKCDCIKTRTLELSKYLFTVVEE